MEFVLLLFPSLMVFNLLFTSTLTSLLRSSSVALAADLAQSCALADFDSARIREIAESQLSPWSHLVSVDCNRDKKWATVSLIAALKAPFEQFDTRVTWHAASETR
jgi:hypothetical protein